jgi:hypothetical protein
MLVLAKGGKAAQLLQLSIRVHELDPEIFYLEPEEGFGLLCIFWISGSDPPPLCPLFCATRDTAERMSLQKKAQGKKKKRVLLAPAAGRFRWYRCLCSLFFLCPLWPICMLGGLATLRRAKKWSLCGCTCSCCREKKCA